MPAEGSISDMRIVKQDGEVQLTYCMNVHPMDSGDDVLSALDSYAAVVGAEVAREQPFGLGLRLSNNALEAFSNSESALSSLKKKLDEHNLYVFTANGFPFGKFQGQSVREAVYSPDWRTPERLRYSLRLAELMAELLPAGVTYGSMNTLPGSYKSWIADGEDYDAVLRNLAEMAWGLDAVRNRTGKHIWLALEPEPKCLWETTADIVRLFEDDFPHRAASLMSERHECSVSYARRILRGYIGVCLDACHLAVMGEALEEVFEHMHRRGIFVPKVHLSAAVAGTVTEETMSRLERMKNERFMQQTGVIRRNGPDTELYEDLSEALAGVSSCDEADARIVPHIHTPLHISPGEGLESTRENLSDRFFSELLKGETEHAEIETYTFDVLPEEFREHSVTEGIVKEFQWVQHRIYG